MKFSWDGVGLGIKSDRKIAAEVGVHHTTVAYHRKRLGIASFGRSKQKIDWSKIPLGEHTDSHVAKLIGVPRGTVIQARLRLGISTFDKKRSQKGIDWDSQPLGKISDTEIAKKLSVAVPVVFCARRRRGIKAVNPREADVDWNTQPLGEYPDDAIARLVGVSQPTVTRVRNKLGIVASKHTFYTPEKEPSNYPEAAIDIYWHEKKIDHKFQVKIGPYIADWVIEGRKVVEYAGFSSSLTWGSAYKERLKKKTNYYLSQGWQVLIIWPQDLQEYDLGILPERCRDPITNGINWAKQPLGQMSDTELAKQLGTSQSVVSLWRKKLGYSVFQKTDVDWAKQPLGKEYDYIIASRLGVSKTTVRRARNKRSIPNLRKGRKCYA